MTATTLTYASLVEDLERYTDRGSSGDTTVIAQIPRLINTAERAIVTDLKLQGYQRVLTDLMASGTSVYAKPDRWKETISVSLVDDATRRQLFARSYEYIRSYWPNESETGRPLFYADYSATHWLLGPTRDAGLSDGNHHLPAPGAALDGEPDQLADRRGPGHAALPRADGAVPRR